jgi:hypothetical protein
VSPRLLVLFPQGPPATAASSDRCLDLVHRAGGDLARIIDAPATSIERFASHVARLGALRESHPALVVLTHCNPVALAVLHARRVLTESVPNLANAAWALFVDPEEDPFFVSSAEADGRLDLPLEHAPIWTAATLERFLILSPAVLPECDVEWRIRVLLLRGELSASGETIWTSELRSKVRRKSSGAMRAVPASGQRSKENAGANEERVTLPDFEQEAAEAREK